MRRLATLRFHTRRGWVTGHIISVPDLPEQLVGDQARAEGLQLRAVQLAADLGASVVGLGSALAVVAGRGEAASERVGIPVTTGHAATAWACADLARQASGDEAVGVLGFRSTVGDAVAALLAEDRVIKVAARGAADHRRAKTLGVSACPEQELLSTCSVLVGAATSGPSVDPAALAPGTVLVDLSNPPSLKPGPTAAGVVVLAGETVSWPGAVRSGGWGTLWRAFAGYEGGLAYACLAEPLAAAAMGCEPWSAGRRLDAARVRACGATLTELGFRPTLHRRRSAPKP
ncbi:MAG: hypothetical protein AB8H79_20810 [Myxococcota bacterium]